MKKKLEICVFNLNDCITASKYNIDRIEFCKERSLGGISPKKDDIKKALNYHENIFPIIRPRKGNFIYNNEELGEMVDLIEYCKKIKFFKFFTNFFKKGKSNNITRKYLCSFMEFFTYF